ncbi:MAG: branched-chain amino acid ABC transporter permease [Candidatus Parcubacteria bacterium]|nr:branched-chain amino acid ABC transporter permease [Burkholderiales bacterium]
MAKASISGSATAIGYGGSSRLRPLEYLPWVLAGVVYFLAPGYLPLGAYILIMILFALSLELLVGYGGIVTLGHSAYFGFGAYIAGILAVHFSGDPLLGLAVAAVAAGLLGLLTGAVILRTHALALLMLTLAITSILYEVASKWTSLTGGSDGMHSVPVEAILGSFNFDMFGKTAYVYCLLVLFVCWWLVRSIVHSPFGMALAGTRENDMRMHAIGAPVYRRRLMAYTIAAALAGVAGALLTHTTQFVGLSVLTFELSGEVLVMLVLGGIRRIYGAFVGPVVFLVARDYLAKQSPEYWMLGIGLLLIVIVMFARGGILGLLDSLISRSGRRKS